MTPRRGLPTPSSRHSASLDLVSGAGFFIDKSTDLCSKVDRSVYKNGLQVMSVTYTKLFSSITESTIWCESPETKVVWVTMLAMADRHGRVWASKPGLANRAQISVKKTILALDRFLSPDEHSRTTDNEGRRIEPIDGGWRLLNHSKYRELRDEEERKAYKREWIRKKRESVDQNVDNVEPSRPAATHTETETETYTEEKELTRKKDAQVHEQKISFAAFWAAYPKRKSKGRAEKLWKKLDLGVQGLIIRHLGERVTTDSTWKEEGGKFIPYPATWLNARGWEDQYEIGREKPDIHERLNDISWLNGGKGQDAQHGVRDIQPQLSNVLERDE
jgi:hypothetical protein